MKDDKIEKIFAQLDLINRKLEYMGKLLDAFDGQDENGSSSNPEE